MNVLTPGHDYELAVLDANPPLKHWLRFVERVGDKYPGNTKANPGTTSQEVLRALLERARYVNKQVPCWQTKLSILLMRWCIWLYEYRAAKIHGWDTSVLSLDRAEWGYCCPICGHVACEDTTHAFE